MRGSVLSPRKRLTSYGQGLAEYALILALIAIVGIIALSFLGVNVAGALSSIGESVGQFFR